MKVGGETYRKSGTEGNGNRRLRRGSALNSKDVPMVIYIFETIPRSRKGLNTKRTVLR